MVIPLTWRMPLSSLPLLSTRTAFTLPPHPGLFVILGGPAHVQFTSTSGTHRQAPEWNPSLTVPSMLGTWSASFARRLWKLEPPYVPTAIRGVTTRTTATPPAWSAPSVMAHTMKITTVLLQLAARATPSRSPLFPPPLMENPVPTWQFIRIAANLMPLTLLIASSGNITLTVSGSWNDMQRRMSSDLVHILLLGKPVPAAKPQLQGVIVEMVGRCKLIRGDLDLFSVQDYPCRYGPCLIACNVIKLGVCSYMFNFLFAPILSSGFNFSCYYFVYNMPR